LFAITEAGQVELREAQASLKDEERAQKMYQEVAGLPGSRKKGGISGTNQQQIRMLDDPG